jgi:hypothetical protein
MYARAFNAAAKAIDDLERLFSRGFQVLDVRRATVCYSLTVGGLGLCRRLFAIGFVDVPPSQRFGLALCSRLLACRAIGACMFLPVGDLRSWSRLEWLQSSWCVYGDAEVAGEWRANVGRALLRINLT